MNRINLFAITDHLIMAVRPCAFAGITYPAYHFPALYRLARMSFHADHMAVQSLISIAMVDDHMNAVAFLFKACGGNRTISRSIDGSANGRSEVKSGMHFRRLINRVYAIPKARS